MVFKRSDQRRLIDKRASGYVNKNGGALDTRELLGANKVMGFRRFR